MDTQKALANDLETAPQVSDGLDANREVVYQRLCLALSQWYLLFVHKTRDVIETLTPCTERKGSEKIDRDF